MRSHITPGHLDDVSFGGVVNGKPSDGEHSWLIPTDNWADIEDWHWACQLQQAQAMRFGVEHMRSLEPVNAGALIWQLNDDWPVVSWPRSISTDTASRSGMRPATSSRRTWPPSAARLRGIP